MVSRTQIVQWPERYATALNAIVWQDTRVDKICIMLAKDGGQDRSLLVSCPSQAANLVAWCTVHFET
jgi:glycerol kinase